LACLGAAIEGHEIILFWLRLMCIPRAHVTQLRARTWSL
jgi:hypothetical protein